MMFRPNAATVDDLTTIRLFGRVVQEIKHALDFHDLHHPHSPPLSEKVEPEPEPVPAYRLARYVGNGSD